MIGTVKAVHVGSCFGIGFANAKGKDAKSKAKRGILSKACIEASIALGVLPMLGATYDGMLVYMQASGQKAYSSKSEELGSNLANYKHARARWEGTDNGAYEAWTLNENFEPLAIKQ